MLWSLAVGCLLGGCAAPPGPTVVASGTTPTGATTPLDTRAPDWTADQAFSQLAGLAEVPLAGTFLEAYAAAMAWGDAGCPGSDTQLTGRTYSGCLADSGVWYQGIADYREESWQSGEESWSMTSLGGEFEIVFADGARFSAGGSAGLGTQLRGDGTTVLHSEVQGTFRDETRTDALGGGLSSYLYATAGADGSEVGLEGGLGLAALSVSFFGLSFGAACAGEPTGLAAVRDPTGYWYELDFGESCGPCGMARFDGQELGEACVDLSGVAEAVRRGFGL